MKKHKELGQMDRYHLYYTLRNKIRNDFNDQVEFNLWNNLFHELWQQVTLDIDSELSKAIFDQNVIISY